ncbi:MAG: hypothetical protein LBS85_07050 [Clostridiales Family XIII bacterium]|jgi:YbbR domain-containing protein|nr:hypothetical protein [Clostridiales Family XIII bacterium]
MLRNNKLNLLISIIAAIVIWAYVTMVVNPARDETIRGIPVELVNLEMLYDRGFTVDRTRSYVVDVTVNGTRSDVLELTASDFKATADMTGYPKGLNSVKVNVTAPGSMKLVQIKPDTISVEVVDLITVTKQVRLAFADKFAAGTEPGFITVTPSEMEVAGTAAAVDNIDYIRAEVPKDILSEEETTLSLEAVPITKSGNPEYFVNLSQNQISVTATLCKTKEVPLRIEVTGEPPESIEVTEMNVPKTIVIRGSKDAVAEITEVRAKGIDMTAISDTAEIPVDAYLPQNVEVADASKNLAVNIKVQGIEKAEFEYTAETIEVRGLADGLSGHLNTGSVKALLLAAESEIADITKDDIHLFVDGSEITESADAIEMAVQFDCDKEFKSITVTPEKVRVTIIKDTAAGSGGTTGNG